MEQATFVLCVNRDGYETSLEIRRIYRSLADPAAAERSLIRVVDETGEDYLFPADFFVPIEVPPPLNIWLHWMRTRARFTRSGLVQLSFDHCVS